MRRIFLLGVFAAAVSPWLFLRGAAQSPRDPFRPIAVEDGVVRVGVADFATVPDTGGQPPRMMLLVSEPGTRRLFVNDMRGPLYSVSLDGKTVRLYVDINAASWGVGVQSAGTERGFQSFAFHPQFAQAGTPGFGKFYTLTDTVNTRTKADFVPGGGSHSHDSVLLEWTAKTPSATTYDGGPPRELIRVEQPYPNHNCGQLAFSPLAAPGSPEFGLLYMGFADGGSGNDPLNLSQDLGSIFGKLLRIDPLGSNSANGKYGIPSSNPFVKRARALGEIYAYGLRNPQRFAWDSKTGSLFVADIGQNMVEEIDLVTAGANLGWNAWEGSFRFSGGSISLVGQRGDPAMTFPVAEYDHEDPVLQSRSAITMGTIYRGRAISQLSNLLLFGDNPSGEIFYVNADTLPRGGQDAIRRVLLHTGSAPRTFLAIIREKNSAMGQPPASRADLRFGEGPNGQVFLLNKRDGTVRVLVPDSEVRR